MHAVTKHVKHTMEISQVQNSKEEQCHKADKLTQIQWAALHC